MTRHDDPLDKVVHLVPVVALGQRSSNPFRSDVKQGEMLFLFDEPLSLFRRNDDSLTLLIIFDDQECVWESGRRV
jgi:hypothetical protein